MATADPVNKPNAPEGENTAYLVLDTESVPDGRLLSLVKYAGQGLEPEEAVARAQAEARAVSSTGSDFLPPCFQYPVAACILRVSGDLRLQALKTLGAPEFRPQRIVEEFWRGVCRYKELTHGQVRIVTFNGRQFDLPLLELAAFRYGCTAREYFLKGRHRFNGELDLLEWLTNYGALRAFGMKLDVFAKLLGKPGKVGTAGDEVYGMYTAGKIQEINDYCMFDTLDTYFVFLRTRVLEGAITLEQEHDLVGKAKKWVTEKTGELPVLNRYLENWGDWTAWP
jgi:predicted PolB exonuclease-like 3'-5' exonuclease